MILIPLVIAGVWFLYSLWYWLIAITGEVASGSLRVYYRARYGVYRGSVAVFFHLLLWGPLLPLVLCAKVVYGLVKGK